MIEVIAATEEINEKLITRSFRKSDVPRILQKIKNEILGYKENNKISNQNFADYLDIHVRTILYLKSEDYGPSFTVLYKYCKFRGLEISEYLKSIGE